MVHRRLGIAAIFLLIGSLYVFGQTSGSSTTYAQWETAPPSVKTLMADVIVAAMEEGMSLESQMAQVNGDDTTAAEGDSAVAWMKEQSTAFWVGAIDYLYLNPKTRDLSVDKVIRARVAFYLVTGK